MLTAHSERQVSATQWRHRGRAHTHEKRRCVDTTHEAGAPADGGRSDLHDDEGGQATRRVRTRTRVLQLEERVQIVKPLHSTPQSRTGPRLWQPVRCDSRRELHNRESSIKASTVFCRGLTSACGLGHVAQVGS